MEVTVWVVVLLYGMLALLGAFVAGLFIEQREQAARLSALDAEVLSLRRRINTMECPDTKGNT